MFGIDHLPEYFGYVVIIIEILFVMKRVLKLKGLGCEAGFLFGMLIYHGIIPLLLLANQSSINYSRVVTFFYGASESGKIISFIGVFLGLLFFYCGTRLRFCVGSFHSRDINDTDVLDKTNIGFENKALSTAALIIFIIGCVSFLVFIYGCGGISRMLSLAEISRSHVDSITNYGVSKVYTYFSLLAAFIPLSNILYTAKLYLQTDPAKLRTKFMFVFTLLMTVLYFLYNAGRAPMLLHGILLTFLFLKKRVKHPWLVILCLAVIGLPLLDYLDSLFIYFNTGELAEINTNYIKYLTEFSDPAILTRNMNSILTEYGPQFFKYCITDIISLFPGVSMPMSYSIVSEYIRGSQWSMLGGIPTDVITYGFLQLGMIGVFFTMLFWGSLFSWIDSLIGKIINKEVRTVFSVALATSVFTIAASCDLYVILQRNINFVFGVAVLVYLNSRKKT